MLTAVKVDFINIYRGFFIVKLILLEAIKYSFPIGLLYSKLALKIKEPDINHFTSGQKPILQKSVLQTHAQTP